MSLEAFAHGRFDLLVRLEGRLRRIAQHVELAHLVRHVRPQLLNCQQLAFLRIADRAEHLHP